MPPVAPMLAKSVPEIPPDRYYEPKWDGFRSIVFRDGDEVVIGSRNQRPMTRYFPEVVAAIKESLPPRCVVDGEIVVAGEDGTSLDFWALQQRIHPAGSRVTMLAEKTPASLVAFDLLALDDASYMGRPFAARRATLEAVLAPAVPPVHLTPITRDIEVARRWFDEFEGAGLEGLIAKSADLTYQPNKRVMAKVKHVRTVDCVVAGYRLHRTAADAVGSLLLGLYENPNDPVVPEELREMTGGSHLVPVGVVGAFPMARRRALLVELQPLVTDFADHPWRWAEHEVTGRPVDGGGSRWNRGGGDFSFVPLRPERVVEVRFDYMEGFRFRHTAQFERWRPDRDPASCGFDQVERPVGVDLASVFATPR
jgi:ATP-dependent DNA ligase